MIIVTSATKAAGKKNAAGPDKMFFCIVNTCRYHDGEGTCYYQGDQRQIIEGARDESDILAHCILYEE